MRSPWRRTGSGCRLDFTESGVERANALVQDTREAFVVRMGYEQLLKVQR
jgi:hypothetical protein